MKSSVKNPILIWEIWRDSQYIGTTTSLQIAEEAQERGFKIVRVQ
jgi:hypothetical protein